MRRACAGAGVVTAALEVSNAFHSPRLASVEDTIRSGLAGRPVSSPVLPFVSTVNAEVCTDPEGLRELWARHASAPVLFEDAVHTAYEQGARVFLQVTGGSSLLTSVRRNLTGHGDVHVVPVEGGAPDGGRSLALALARLAVLGAPVDPRALVRREDRRLLDLPVAKLDTRSYWVADRRTANESAPTKSAPTEETPMNDSTNDSVNDSMGELLQLVQQQVTLLSRLGKTLTAPNAAEQTPAPPAPAAPAPADEMPVPVEPPRRGHRSRPRARGPDQRVPGERSA